MVNKTVVELSMRPIIGNKAIVPRHLMSGNETTSSCISSVHPAGAPDPCTCRGISLTVVQIGKTDGDRWGRVVQAPPPLPYICPCCF